MACGALFDMSFRTINDIMLFRAILSTGRWATAWAARKFGMTLTGIVKPSNRRLDCFVVWKTFLECFRNLDCPIVFGVAGIGFVDAIGARERDGERLRRFRRLLMRFG